MPDPIWTFQYSMNQTPEGNGFTRTLVNSPVVNIVTGGSPANRRVEVQSNNGDCIFLTSSVPALDDLVGITAEALVNVSGIGDAGFEATFLNKAIGLNIFANKVFVDLPGDPGIHQEQATAANVGDILWRVTCDATSFRLYRAAVLVLGPITCPSYSSPFQRFLFWGEGGGTQIFKSMKFYIGGAVAP